MSQYIFQVMKWSNNTNEWTVTAENLRWLNLKKSKKKKVFNTAGFFFFWDNLTSFLIS